MEYAAIPLAVLNSEKFLSLSMQQRMFLIDLYAIFLDCETFTIYMKRPQDYRQKPFSGMSKKIASLINSGFLKVVGSQVVDECHTRRVFSFCYPPIDYFYHDDLVSEEELNDALLSLNHNYAVMQDVRTDCGG